MKIRHRTLFLSDVHLGSMHSRADELERLLMKLDFEKLYLVGDIVDLLEMDRRWRWTDACDRVVHRILELARHGVPVVYVPGNHDEAARHLVGSEIGGIPVRLSDIHETADGRRLLITHGDQYDSPEKMESFLHRLGSDTYNLLLRVNGAISRMRRFFRLPYWSFAAFFKDQLPVVGRHAKDFAAELTAEAAEKGCDGVVCGHIHNAECRPGEISYYNCGDWVESFTALVERYDGGLELVNGMAFAEDLAEPRFIESEAY